MNREQLDEIRARYTEFEARQEACYGLPDSNAARSAVEGAQDCAFDVPALLDEIDRLRKLLAHDLAPEEWEAHAYKLGADYEWSAPAVGTFVGWLAYRHETERANNKILRSVIERRTTAEGPAEGGTQKGSSEVSRCPNCAPGYDCESGNYGGGPTGEETP